MTRVDEDGNFWKEVFWTACGVTVVALGCAAVMAPVSGPVALAPLGVAVASAIVATVAAPMAMIEESGISEKIADNVKVVTKTLKEKLPQKTYSTYTKYNPETEQIYVGRTSGYFDPKVNIKIRDYCHHMNKKGFGPAIEDVSSRSYAAIRGREQMMIEKFRREGRSGNAINGISDKNKKRGNCSEAGLITC